MANVVYEDLGQIINSADIANDAWAWSETFNSYHWVRNMIFQIISNTAHEIWLAKVSTDNTKVGEAILIKDSLGVTDPTYYTVTTITGENSIVGYAFKIGIRNKSGSGDMTVKCNLQVLR